MSTSLKKYFPAGTPVKWSASAENFFPSSGELILNDDTTLTIKLKSSRILFSWDGGGTKTVYFGSKQLTSTSPIYLGDDGLMTKIETQAFYNDSTTKNVFLDAEGFPNKARALYDIFNEDTNTIENIEIINSSHITDFEFVFANMKHIKTVSVDTSGATTLIQMFADSAIENSPLLNTSNVTNVMGMFYNCTNLKYIPQYDFSKVTDMSYMFGHCESLTSIPDMDTSNVTDMREMFVDCYNLTTIPKLNTSKVTDMHNMFDYCKSLTSVPDMDTSNVTNMSCMFAVCKNLISAPQLDTSKATDMHDMFSGCNNLKSVPQLDASSITSIQSFAGISSIFSMCYELTDFGGFINLKVDLDMGSCKKLTHESAMNIINNLAPVSVSRTLKFAKTTFDTLTPAEIAKATNKGWKIVAE